MKSVQRVLFVCLGNICRSPLAEGLFIYKTRQLDLASEFICDSAGTASYHIGELPDIRTRNNARLNGIELTHRARQFRISDFDKFDMILAMDSQNLKHLSALARKEPEMLKIRLMREFDPLHPGQDVPDPWYGGEEGFQEVYEILDRSIDSFLRHLSKKQ